MVSRLNVSRWQEQAPCAEEAEEKDRKISGGPLYLTADVLTILDSGPDKVFPWGKDCSRVMKTKLEWSNDDAATAIREALHHGLFKGSEWCSHSPGSPAVACDAYALRRKEWNEWLRKELVCEYYLKFAINKTGTFVLLVRCHV